MLVSPLYSAWTYLVLEWPVSLVGSLDKSQNKRLLLFLLNLPNCVFCGVNCNITISVGNFQNDHYIGTLVMLRLSLNTRGVTYNGLFSEWHYCPSYIAMNSTYLVCKILWELYFVKSSRWQCDGVIPNWCFNQYSERRQQEQTQAPHHRKKCDFCLRLRNLKLSHD